ncbi:MAG: alpha/beta hydrolase [Rubrivivax sp.]|jgi:arylformamidase|nr:alpha/beta hydrolase [Rubrivivax sp.]
MATRQPASWYDAQYDARAGIPEQASIRQGWQDRSAQTRATVPCQLDLPYGPDGTERLDIFGAPPPTGQPMAPVLVYIHGGYWRALDKRDQSFVATPFVDAGALVVLPNYALAPAVTVRHIVLQMVQALAWVHRHIHRYGGDARRIVVAGHSAGGHLAAMMLACRWNQVGPDLPPQVLHAALAVSGVFDLAPLRRAPFLAPDLKLSAPEARALSPACLPAPQHAPLVAVVGGDESSEFHRQTQLIRQTWGDGVVPVCESLPGRHHMSVLHDLAEPGTRLHTLARGLLDI